MTLKAHADSQGVLTDGYERRILLQALTQKPATNDLKPKNSGYGILAKYSPGPSEEDIDQDRREMFRGFAEDAR